MTGEAVPFTGHVPAAADAALDGPHWAFSLALYGNRDVAAACLDLQDRHGVDVNMLLVCLYRRAEGHGVDAERVASAEAAISPWRQQVIEPLRSLRRSMKAGVAPASASESAFARKSVADAELAAEQVCQKLLVAALSSDGRILATAGLRQTLAAVLSVYISDAAMLAAALEQLCSVIEKPLLALAGRR